MSVWLSEKHMWHFRCRPRNQFSVDTYSKKNSFFLHSKTWDYIGCISKWNHFSFWWKLVLGSEGFHIEERKRHCLIKVTLKLGKKKFSHKVSKRDCVIEVPGREICIVILNLNSLLTRDLLFSSAGIFWGFRCLSNISTF